LLYENKVIGLSLLKIMSMDLGTCPEIAAVNSCSSTNFDTMKF